MYTIERMTKQTADAISTWKYPPPYNFYDLSQDDIDELMCGEYFQATEADNLVGYFCFGKSACVPAGYAASAYDEPLLDIGLGILPKLCGLGKGYDFIMSGMKFANIRFAPNGFRLTVATFNTRAIKVYEHAGYIKKTEFISAHNDNSTAFQTMVKQLN